VTYADAPTDSTDARERREFESAAAAAEILERQRHTEQCRDGWLGEDSERRPVPCSRCRPWLFRIACRTCSAPWHTCLRQIDRSRGACCELCNHRPAAMEATHDD
jgi:hypothetical protein